MSQFYIGTKQIFAHELEKDGKPGYSVTYDYGTKKAYTSWSPKDKFEEAYLPQGTEPSKITQEMVDGFIFKTVVTTIGEKTTVVQATLRNGFEIIESSSCVDVANYDEELGKSICLAKIKDRVWYLLGFALQWAKTGVATNK